MGTQEENQEGTSAQRRNQGGQEGSHVLSRPSITDAVPPHLVAEMQMMKERMDFMMNAFRGRVSNELDDLVH